MKTKESYLKQWEGGYSRELESHAWLLHSLAGGEPYMFSS